MCMDSADAPPSNVRSTRTSQLTGRHAAVMAGPSHSCYYGTTDVASSLEEGYQRLQVRTRLYSGGE
jgi:hypothetical protein